MMRIVGNEYRLDIKIGSGSFGDVYLGTNIISGETVAVKLESRTAKNPKLESEYKIYQALAGGIGISHVHWFGRAGEYNALVLDALGPSLHDLFRFCDKKFTLKTVLMLADQLLKRIEYIHKNNIIHRDIKPANFVMGLDMRQLNEVYVIDFGLSKRFRDPESRIHIPCVQRNSMTGTAKFSSINAHCGVEQSRRDDLESLGYTLIQLACGRLPWQGMKANSKKELNEMIMEKKIRTPVEVLCKDLPSEFATYIHYCRALIFDEKPDYKALRQLFRNVFIRKGFCEDFVFDWTILNRRKSAALDKMIDSPRDRMSTSRTSKTSDKSGEQHREFISAPESNNDSLTILQISNYI